MNAVQSASTLAWRASAAFNPAFDVGPVDPADVYEFIGRSTFDDEFRAQIATDAEEVLARFRLPVQGRVRDPSSLHQRLQLDAQERALLDELSQTIQRHGLAGGRAAERGALREGYGMPAVAALVLVVAIAVAVYVFVFSHPVP